MFRNTHDEESHDPEPIRRNTSPHNANMARRERAFPWTEERFQTAARLWREGGKSAQDVADYLSHVFSTRCTAPSTLPALRSTVTSWRPPP